MRCPGIAFMPFAPLMRGLIARRFTGVDELDDTDTRRRGSYPRLAGESLEKNLELAQLVWEIRRRPRRHACAGRDRVAAFPLPHRDPDPRHPERQAAGGEPGAQELDLTEDELSRLDAVVPAAVGDRYPNMASIDA